METVVPLARKAPDAAAALNLRPNARQANTPPILQPDGRPLPSCRVPLPLDAAGEATLAAWAAQAAASEWPTGRNIRAELLDGAGDSLRSQVLDPAVFGVAPTAAPAPEPPPMAPRPRLTLDLGDGGAGAVIGALFEQNAELVRACKDLSGEHAKTARELGGVLGRVAAAGTAQSGALASTVASAHAAQAEATAAALREARLARSTEAAAVAEATEATTALDLLRQGVTEAGEARGVSPQLAMAAQLLGPLLAHAAAPSSSPAPAAASPAPAAASPAPPAPAGLPPAAAEAPAGARLAELLRMANAGDPEARALLRGAVAASGGFVGLGWMAEG